MPINHVGLAVLCALVLTLAGCKEQKLAIDSPAPELAVLDASQQKMTLESLRGQPVVVEFWSSTCGACLVMMKAWQKYADEHPGKMRFVGVGIKPYPEDLTAFANKLNVSLPLGLDQLGITQERYQVEATPMTYFIDRQGILREIHVGYSPDMDLDHYVNLIQ